MTDDEMMATDGFKAGKLVHDLCSVVDGLADLKPEALDRALDGVISGQLALMSLIIRQQQWREAKKRKPDVLERLCQVRH